MTHTVTKKASSVGNSKKSATAKSKPARMAPATPGEVLVKGVVMGFIISGLTRASKSITRTLVNNPLAVVSTGLLTGYLTYKYRKEIIVLGSRTAVESKNFLLRQKQHLGDLLSPVEENNNNDPT
ncbi:MAG: hypothetical protein HOO92_06150 [Methylococcaceae bacterium]|nr:hypothetical protein [Methylococcaceae bacterium]